MLIFSSSCSSHRSCCCRRPGFVFTRLEETEKGETDHRAFKMSSTQYVQDVLHQQVPLQAVDPVAVQRHLVAARRAAKASAAVGRAGGAAALPQGVGRLERGEYE
ncbi:hypothetical protein EYF80_004403 [Liparis tanakae]|uniref:Uncharacterized protein n=1 Tax=Liparis tanakae TaxID=230148 RepID=A0A4Z2J633_9TELE|nr:hypothetical protein EYF80_004403 [Liparis tanakae]